MSKTPKNRRALARSTASNLLILSRCMRDDERDFYIRLCLREKWGKRELQRQLNGALFERTILSPPILAPAVRELHPDAPAVFKDTYLLDFLDLPLSYSEGDLQTALVEQLRRFLIELGRDFCFVGGQYQLQVGGRDFYVDLLFFNRALSCLVAFELKVEGSNRSTSVSCNSTSKRWTGTSARPTRGPRSVCSYAPQRTMRWSSTR
jgi:predicted nuclease of restriction endonuclease-like (RecB) superfamily